MRRNVTRFTFPGSQGTPLDARLDLPPGPTRALALFAHCFTCAKDIAAASRIAPAWWARASACCASTSPASASSDGDFANTNFSSNVEDLVAAADLLREQHEAPRRAGRPQPRRRRGAGGRGRDPRGRRRRHHRRPADPAHVSGLLAARGAGGDRGRRRGRGRPGRPAVPHPQAVPRRHLRPEAAEAVARPGRRAAGPALAGRRAGRHRQRPPDLRGRAAPEELRLARRRRPPALRSRRRRLRRRADRRLGGPLPARSPRGRADRGRVSGRRGGRHRRLHPGGPRGPPHAPRRRADHGSATTPGPPPTTCCWPRSAPAPR